MPHAKEPENTESDDWRWRVYAMLLPGAWRWSART